MAEIIETPVPAEETITLMAWAAEERVPPAQAKHLAAHHKIDKDARKSAAEFRALLVAALKARI